jgi:hypothetical protein
MSKMDMVGLFRAVGIIAGLLSFVRNHRAFVVLYRRVRRCPSCVPEHGLCTAHQFERTVIRHGMHETYDAWLTGDEWTVPTGPESDR